MQTKSLLRPIINTLSINFSRCRIGRNPSRFSSNISQSSIEAKNNCETNQEKEVYQISSYLSVERTFDQAKNSSYINAKVVPTGREGKVIKLDNTKKACVLCSLNLKNLDYTDVKILSQFIDKNGKMVTIEESKLCGSQYGKVMRLISTAQRCNLIPRPYDYLVPGPWHDLNTYIERDRRRDQPMKVIKKDYWNI